MRFGIRISTESRAGLSERHPTAEPKLYTWSSEVNVVCLRRLGFSLAVGLCYVGGEMFCHRSSGYDGETSAHGM